MSDLLREMLTASQSAEQSRRRGAEIAIHDFFSNYANAVPVLLAFASDGNEDVHMRHLSILLLNQQIAQFWVNFGADIKRDITVFAFRWVSLFVADAFVGNMSTFHSSATILLAKVYDAGTKEEAEHIATALASELQSDQLPALFFSLRCLYEISREVQYDRQADLLRICYPRVQDLVNGADTSNPMHNRILLYCAKFMCISVRKFSDAQIAEGFGEYASAIIGEYIPRWSRTAYDWVARHTQDLGTIVSSLPVIIQSLKSLSIAVDSFCDDCGLDLDATNDMCRTLLRNIQSVYESQSGQGSAATGYSSDGDKEDIEILVVHVFELLCASLSATGGVNESSFEAEQASVSSLVALLSDYMSLSSEQVDLWLCESNEFVSSEYDESSESNLRHTCREVVNEICRSSRGAAYLSVVTLVQQSFTQYQGSSLDGSQRRKALLRLEGTLWMLGSMRNKYMNSIKTHARSASAESGKLSRSASVIAMVPQMSVAALIGSAVSMISELPPEDCVYILQSRVVWLCGEYADIFVRGPSMNQLALHCLTLMSPQVPLTLRFHACHTLGVLLVKGKCDPAIFADESCLRLAITACAQLAALADENTAHFPVETALSLLGDNSEISPDIIGNAVSLGLNVWFRFMSDALVLDAARKLVSKLLRIAPVHAAPLLNSTYLPHLKKVLSSSDSRIPSSFLDTMVKFLPTLVKSAHGLYDAGMSSVRVEALQLLVGVVNSPSFSPSHCEAMQAINSVLSLGSQDDMGVFPQASLMIDFANAIAHIVSSVFDSLISEEKGLDAGNRFSNCTGPAVGLFCHLLIKCKAVLSKDALLGLVKKANVCLQIHKSEYVRSAIGMGFVHIFARDPSLIAMLLMQCQAEEGVIPGNRVMMENGSGVPVLDLWYSLHTDRLSCYNGSVSTLGLLQLVAILGADTSTQHLACNFLQLLLYHLPKVLQALLPGHEESENDESEHSYSDSDQVCESDDWEDEDLHDDDDEDEDWEDGSQEDDEDSPFAPSEMYLSDLIDTNPSTAVSISDNLMYAPALRTDPILLAGSEASSQRIEYGKIANSVQDRVASFLRSLYQSGSFPQWMDRLPQENMRLVLALINS